jgi:hypothetical protein
MPRNAITRSLTLALSLAIAAAGWMFAAPAQSPPRVALVIGNDTYPKMPLLNAVNDARAIDRVLRDAGFSVDLVIDATLKEFDAAVDRFQSRLRAGDIALFFYSGHGMQIANENYLVPVDFTAQEETDAKYQSVSASRIADRINDARVRLSIIILDACRNNPFRSVRSSTRGLAPMESGRGGLIAFATAPNRTADDNPGGTNGLFTTYVLEAMRQPGLGVEQVFSRARQKVYEASRGAQIPWSVSSVIGDFYFVPPGAAVETTPALSLRHPDDPKVAIADLLARYRRAYEEKDVDALMRIFPKFAGKAELQRRFDDVVAVAMALGVPNITVSSETSAKAVALYTLIYTTKAGRTENATPRSPQAEFTFTRLNGEWVIESVRFR